MTICPLSCIGRIFYSRGLFFDNYCAYGGFGGESTQGFGFCPQGIMFKAQGGCVMSRFKLPMMDSDDDGQPKTGGIVAPTNEVNSEQPDDKENSVHSVLLALSAALESGMEHSLRMAENALQSFPTNPDLLSLASLAALLEGKPDVCMRYQRRLERQFIPNQRDELMRAVAAAQKKQWAIAVQLARRGGLFSLPPAVYYPGLSRITQWVSDWMRILRTAAVQEGKAKATPPPPKKKKPAVGKTVRKVPAVAAQPSAPQPPSWVPEVSGLSRPDADIPIQFVWPEAGDITLPSSIGGREEVAWFHLRGELTHLSLLQGFDELLCLTYLQHVDTYWYQVETVRKVLRQFRGRVLLADEVGLGKTIEAGMVLKEYLLRGMVDRVLILTPASLVGQWQEEMESKFGLSFDTSYDALLREDPQAFWQRKRIIASIAAARRDPHFSILAEQNYDLIIVDEAHHLKNRNTLNWKLVDALKKRFLILLSATPVQNSLVELYNLLTLLKPGIFKTEKEFRNAYMTPRQPRIPANRQQLRDLMREVMIRNTRSLVDVRLPPRHAVTIRLKAEAEERACYDTLTHLIGAVHTQEENQQRLALHHLLTAAGSSPAAGASVVERFAAKRQGDEPWRQLHSRYVNLSGGIKEKALLDLLQRNPAEKKMVFIHHRESMERLDQVLREMGTGFVRFDGSMSGPAKDAAIACFRDQVAVLLCSESGGEGRNIQFCNTMINFDLPWNPMVIEQRIGRIHRIGQTREVFIFNLVVQDTVEDHVLKILDEKINMFELVVGEVDAILGEMDDQRDFSEMVFSAWVETTEQQRTSAFVELGERMVAAKVRYEDVKALDSHLFGTEFETG
ncbi:MAG: SNF2-related protein [Magnetococcales bacterium]|nr:SNF2-related protein [Magnetococcales bacterium]